MIEPPQSHTQTPQPWTPPAGAGSSGEVGRADEVGQADEIGRAGLSVEANAGAAWGDDAAWGEEAEGSAAVTATPAEKIDAKRLVNWLKPPRSEVERARDSERYFWLKTMVLVGFFAAIAAAGIVRVQHTTGGVRVAYELVKTNDELRIKIEANRRLEAVLTGLKNPNSLRREAADKFEMHAPAAAEVLEVN